MTFGLALLTAALTGFISLSYEILWYRAYSFVSGGAPAVFGLLLGAFLLGLAVGAFGSGLYCRERTATGEPSQLQRLGIFIAAANLVGFLVLPTAAEMATRVHWALSLPLVSLAAGLFGATLPLVSHFGIAPDELVGARLSYVYLANILGSAAGSLLTGFVLMDRLPLKVIAMVLALTGLVVAALLLVAGRLASHRLIPALLAAGAAGGVFAWATPRAYDRVYERLLYKRHYSEEHRFRDLVETRSGVVAVSHRGTVFGGGAYDGRISTDLLDDRNGIVRAFAVPALHPRPRRILMIGLSTGAWAQVLARLPGLESLTVVEINPGYLRVISRYPEVSGVLENPKVRVVIDDGRRWLARHPHETFDVIVMNTTFHWRAHITNLLSEEFLTLVRKRLRPGGIYHFNATSSDDAFYTAFTVFPHGLRFMSFATVSDSPIRVDAARWRRILSEYEINGRPVLNLEREEERARLEEIVRLVGSLDGPASKDSAFETRQAVLARLSRPRLVTDDNMAPEWQHFFPTIWVPEDER